MATTGYRTSVSNAPCKDCTKRCVGCHSTCEEYIDFNKKAEEERLSRYNRAEFNYILNYSRRYPCGSKI